MRKERTASAAARGYASSSPQRLLDLVENLSEIEGRAGNLLGILFELLVAYLVRRTASSIDMGIIARHPDTRKPVDMDVVAFSNAGSEITIVECKAKEPGGKLTLAEVDEWLTKIAVMRAHYKNDPYRRDAKLRFELWTTGEIETDALEKLVEEQKMRSKTPLDWKDGQAVLQVAKDDREKAITDALYQHFIRHPLAAVAIEVERENLLPIPSSTPPLPVDFGGPPWGARAPSKKLPDPPMAAVPPWKERVDDLF